MSNLLILNTFRICYAPYQVLKRCGIKGPTPLPVIGNYLLMAKLVGLLINNNFMETLYDYHNIISRDKICSSLTTYTRLMDLYPGELAVSLTRSKVTWLWPANPQCMYVHSGHIKLSQSFWSYHIPFQILRGKHPLDTRAWPWIDQADHSEGLWLFHGSLSEQYYI